MRRAPHPTRDAPGQDLGPKVTFSDKKRGRARSRTGDVIAHQTTTSSESPITVSRGLLVPARVRARGPAVLTRPASSVTLIDRLIRVSNRWNAERKTK